MCKFSTIYEPFAPSGPAAPAFCLTIGVIGHRSDALPQGALALIEPRLGEVLDDIATLLERGDIPLTRAGDLIEQAARAMLADLGEWQLAHQQHELTVG